MRGDRLAAVTKEFNGLSFFWRLLGTLALVVATYNPSGVSYFHWLMNSMGAEDRGLGPEHFVVGAALVAGWAVLVVAAQRSLGTVGLVLGATVIGGVVWLLTDIGIVSVGSVSALAWVSLICLALLLAVGLSWSHVWRRLTGQYEVDED